MMIEEIERITSAALKQITLKNRVWVAALIIIGFLAIVMYLEMFYRPKNDISTFVVDANRKERQALEEKAKAYKSLVNTLTERVHQMESRDSVLITSVISNETEIKKIKIRANESVKRFDNYTSNEWASYFANLPEPRQFIDSK